MSRAHDEDRMGAKALCPWCGRDIRLSGFATDLQGGSVLQWHYLPIQDSSKPGQECPGSLRSLASWALKVPRERLREQIANDPDLPSEAGHC